MSTTTHSTGSPDGATAPPPARGPATRWLDLLGPPARRRMAALARAELTLLVRNRTTLFSVLVMPALMIFFFYSMSDVMGMDESELGIGVMLGTSAVGMILFLVVYGGLVASYVARREERVLKRLRTGEITDAEIFTGTALPSVLIALIQIVALIGVGSALPGLDFPARPDLVLVGVLLGLPLLTLLAIVTAAFTRTVESSQLTAMPVLLVGMVTSGMMVPLDTLPDSLINVFEKLPFTPVMEFVRAGWLGDTSGDLFQALVVAVAWIVLTGYVARRYFRWDPRS